MGADETVPQAPTASIAADGPRTAYDVTSHMGREALVERTIGLSRRRFLAATGLVTTAAAAAQLPGFAGRWRAGAQSADDLLGPLLGDTAEPLLQELGRDTIAGLVAFVVPGPDAYSRAQGVTDDTGGGVAARGPDFLLDALDQFLPVPDTYTQALAASMVTGASSSPLALPDELVDGMLEVTRTLDEALLDLFANDQEVPVSLALALLVNYAASATHPEAIVDGPFLSPFANLSFDQKMDAWQFLESDTAQLVAALDSDLPEPLAGSLSGLIEFAAGALVEFAAFGAFSEWGVFDRASQSVSERPVGWDMTDYLPGRTEPVHGHDELIGYYGGVDAADG